METSLDLIQKQEKLRSNAGWLVVQEYEQEELADNSEVEKRIQKAQEPCVLIGYPSRNDEPILPSRNFPDKSFVDQACSLKMARYWPPSFLRFRFYRPRWTLSWSIKRQEQLA